LRESNCDVVNCKPFYDFPLSDGSSLGKIDSF
jgi:hypothetical protein